MAKRFAVGLSAIALAFAAVPAHAATDLGTIALSDANPGADFFSFFSFSDFNMTAGDYVVKYSFGFPTVGSGAGDISASLVGGDNTSFDSVDLNGTAFNLTASNTLGDLTGASILGLPSINLLTVNFKVLNDGVGAFNGSVSATAVPEPGTWGMMLLGFGVIGYAMRRRGKVTTRVNYLAT